jgi:hypothetical protein
MMGPPYDAARHVAARFPEAFTMRDADIGMRDSTT